MGRKVGICFLQYIDINKPLRKDMEKRFIADELIRVANVLDEMGLTKEANSIDKIARKVISQNTVPESAGDYAKDIQTYKELLHADLNNRGPAEEFHTKVISKGYLTLKQQLSFGAQVERLIQMSKFDENERLQLNKTIYDLVKKYNLDDPNINEAEFEKRWTESKLNKQVPYVLSTYNILRAKLRKL